MYSKRVQTLLSKVASSPGQVPFLEYAAEVERLSEAELEELGHVLALRAGIGRCAAEAAEPSGYKQ